MRKTTQHNLESSSNQIIHILYAAIKRGGDTTKNSIHSFDSNLHPR